jgi:hypothetical protein
MHNASARVQAGGAAGLQVGTPHPTAHVRAQASMRVQALPLTLTQPHPPPTHERAHVAWVLDAIQRQQARPCQRALQRPRVFRARTSVRAGRSRLPT